MAIMDAHSITDYDIQALVDNELAWEDEKRVRAFLKENPNAYKRYKELAMQRNTLQNWWKNSKKYH